MRVLIGADGSPHGTQGIVAACRLLSPAQRRVDLVCVAPKLNTRNPTFQHKLIRRAARIAVRVAGELAAEGMEAKPTPLTGSVVRTIARHSRDYDLLIICAKSHDEPTQMGLGPVANRLLEHAHTSVLIGRVGSTAPAQRVLLPVDGSEVSLRALDKLNEFVNLAEAEVTLLHVVETYWLPTEETAEAFEDQTAAEEPGLQAEPPSGLVAGFTIDGEAFIEAARARLPKRTVVSTMIEEGVAADQILSEAARGECDLIVLAAASEIDLKHRILGSVSSKVAWNAPCSVLLVHVND